MPTVLDRSLAPPIQSLQVSPFPQVQVRYLGGGMPVYLLPWGQAEVAEIQLAYPHGSVHSPVPGAMQLASRLLTEGTHSRTSLQLVQALDFYGAYLQHELSSETACLSLTTLSKHLAHTLPLMAEAALHSSLPEAELELMRSRMLRQMEVDEQKTSWQARRRWAQRFYGEHPYGQTLSREHLQALSRDQVSEAYQQLLAPARGGVLVVCGRFDEKDTLRQLEASFGHLPWQKAQLKETSPAPQSTPGYEHIRMEGKGQSTLQTGHIALPRHSPDHYRARFVALMLGGYFGSRLMQNIRQDKGYTYGIYASWLAQRQAGHLLIAADMDNQYVQPALDEIRSELQNLIDQEPEQQELDTARNYYLGRVMAGRETPFQLGETIRVLLGYDLPTDDLDTGIAQVMQLKPADIQALAQQYFHPDRLFTVVAGG